MMSFTKRVWNAVTVVVR